MPSSYLSRQEPEQVTLDLALYGPNLAMPQTRKGIWATARRQLTALDCYQRSAASYSRTSSSLSSPLCLVPQKGHTISISFSLPMNFSRNFSGPRKLTSPQAHAGHSAFTSYLFLDIFPSYNKKLYAVAILSVFRSGERRCLLTILVPIDFFHHGFSRFR